MAGTGMVSVSAGERLRLPEVTLCAVTSVNVAATLAAIEHSITQIEFGDVMIITDADLSPVHPEIRVERIPPIRSASEYSIFLMTTLHAHIATSHCLIVQWDGHVLSAERWRPQFLEFDYIGATWPQFDDGANVGNGGFSLRSRRLLKVCAASAFPDAHPEDVTICRTYRSQLEARGLRFAPADLADLFSTERASLLHQSFGYHGVFNMPPSLGAERFWQVYRTLDNRDPVWHDLWSISFYVLHGAKGWRRAALLMCHRLLAARAVRWLLRGVDVLFRRTR